MFTKTRIAVSLLSVRGIARLAVALLFAWGSAAGAASDVVIKVLSNRADLLSGGNALVEVVLPAGASATGLQVTVDGGDVSNQFAPRADGRILGLVSGLAERTSRLAAVLPDGRGAFIDLTNHPIGGPIFSGPQVQPWTCSSGALDAQCNRQPVYSFSYMSTEGGGLQAYNPQNPPDDVAMTTTDEGKTVPFIVRTETGTILRDQYRIAVLFDPAKPWLPTEPQPQWNRKLLITHGASCDITFAAGSAPSVTSDTITGSSPTVALGRGFAVLSHALDNSGHNCDLVTQAEALIATKEYLVDHYGGPIRYTIGTGCSGGALAQQHIANAYPGVYQGILPQCSFTDSWSSTMQYQDYVLSRRYYENPSLWGTGVVWAPHQIAAINGHPNPSNPITFTTVIAPTRDPSRSCAGLSASLVYHHVTNPFGIRCSIMDYMVNRVGRREPEAWTPNETLRGEGHARSPYDNVGIQYGLRGLLGGILTPSQYVDVNVKFGAKDIDYEQQEPRRAADPRSVELAMRTGAVNVGNNMAEVAIIDLRGPDPGAFHDVYRTYAMRERLMREQGHVDNHILWRGSVALLGDVKFTTEGLLAMDQWLAAIEADQRDIPLAQKVVEDKPASVQHRCTDGNGTDVPAAYCDAVVESYSTPRIEAGMPLSDDILKCDLKPHKRDDYFINVNGVRVPVLFTDAEWAALEAAFPTGVCDYSKPGPQWTLTVPWLDYTTTVGGEPMGPAPVSVSFAPQLPDLTAAAPTLSTQRVQGGDQVTFNAEVSNVGTSGAASVVVRFLVDGMQLGVDRALASLGSGASAVVSSATWSAKQQDGAHSVQVLVDPANTIAESTEANNSASTAFLVRGNKIRNGSFEQSSDGSSPDAWTSSGSTGYENGGTDGERSTSTQPGGSWSSEPVAVTPGTSYLASVQVSGSGGTLVVQQLGSNGAVLAAASQPLPGSAVFQSVGFSVTAIAGVAQLRVVLVGGPLGKTTFDNVQLVQN